MRCLGLVDGPNRAIDDGRVEVGDEAYDRGAAILTQFFHRYLREFLHPDLSPRGRQIIECCLQNGAVADYESLLG